MLSDDKEATIFKGISYKDPKSCDQIDRIVISEVHEYLRLVSKQSPGSDRFVDFSKADRTRNLSSPFIEQNMIGMLEASDFERID